MSFDPEMFGQAMGEAIRKAVEPLQAEIERLKTRCQQLGEDAKSLRDVVNEDAEATQKAIKNIPAGKDCDMEAVKCMIAEAVKEIPAPADGKDGANGKDGASITLEDVRPMLDEAVKGIRAEAVQAIEAAIKAMPAPKDGRDGRDGVDGKDGAPGEKGADGAGVADLMVDRDGALVATMTDGRMKNLGVIVGKDGRDGVDGKDGIGLDSFDMEYLDETHEIRIKAACGDRVKEVRYPAGGIHGKGYWREGVKVAAGDAWTHDGCLWYAKTATTDKPDPSSGNWFLAARKGRDGERGPKGKDGSPPAPIKLKD